VRLFIIPEWQIEEAAQHEAPPLIVKREGSFTAKIKRILRLLGEIRCVIDRLGKRVARRDGEVFNAPVKRE
jgi:hypothetical protein